MDVLESIHTLHPAHNKDSLHVFECPEEVQAFLLECISRPEFQSASSERHQVHLCKDWGRDALPKGVSNRTLAILFGLQPSTIQWHLSRPCDLDTGSPELRPQLN